MLADLADLSDGDCDGEGLSTTPAPSEATTLEFNGVADALSDDPDCGSECAETTPGDSSLEWTEDTPRLAGWPMNVRLLSFEARFIKHKIRFQV